MRAISAGVYASIEISLFAVHTGHRRLTNEAHLWYVPVNVNDADHVMHVPPMSMTDEQRTYGINEYTHTSRQRSCTALYTHGPGTNTFVSLISATGFWTLLTVLVLLMPSVPIYCRRFYVRYEW